MPYPQWPFPGIHSFCKGGNSSVKHHEEAPAVRKASDGPAATPYHLPGSGGQALNVLAILVGFQRAGELREPPADRGTVAA